VAAGMTDTILKEELYLSYITWLQELGWGLCLFFAPIRKLLTETT